MDPMKIYHLPGTPPGTLKPPEGEPPGIRIVHTRYGPSDYACREIADPAALEGIESEPGVHWIHVVGLGDVEAIARLGEIFSLHPLALEDVLNLGQRPKVDDFEKMLFVVLQHLRIREAAVIRTQIAIFVAERTVISLQPSGTDLFEPIRDRITRARGRMRHRGPAYLTYAVADLVVDSAFPALESIGDELDALEDVLLDRPDREAVESLQAIRRELLSLRQVLWAHREVVARLSREDGGILQAEERLYFRDCHDHAVQSLEVAENYRETASTLIDVYLSSLSHRLNDIMKVLTVLSTFFMPLAFLASVYGMNFDTSSPWNMPELGWKYGYLAFWGASLGLSGTMLWLFRRRGWL